MPPVQPDDCSRESALIEFPRNGATGVPRDLTSRTKWSDGDPLHYAFIDNLAAMTERDPLGEVMLPDFTSVQTWGVLDPNTQYDLRVGFFCLAEPDNPQEVEAANVLFTTGDT